MLASAGQAVGLPIVDAVQESTTGDEVSFEHNGEQFKASRLYEYHKPGDALFGIAKRAFGAKGNPEQRCKLTINKGGISVSHKGEKHESCEVVSKAVADKWLAEKAKRGSAAQ